MLVIETTTKDRIIISTDQGEVVLYYLGGSKSKPRIGIKANKDKFDVMREKDFASKEISKRRETT